MRNECDSLQSTAGNFCYTSSMNTPLGWDLQDNKLVRTFEFGTFEEAITFVNQVAAIATELNHHPEIINMYNRVTLRLSTHDLPALSDGREQAGAGDTVTEKDTAFAERIHSF